MSLPLALASPIASFSEKARLYNGASGVMRFWSEAVRPVRSPSARIGSLAKIRPRSDILGQKMVSSRSHQLVNRRLTSTAATDAASSSLWHRLKQIPATYPFVFGVILSGCKTSFSDWLVQKVIEQKEQIDWKRNGAFALFGFVYLGGVQYMLYVPIFSRLFPTAATFAAKSIRDKVKDFRGMLSLFGQVFVDQCIHHPLLYFPAFYCTRELVMCPSGTPNFSRVLQGT
jgi:hypothetical protein